MREETEERDRMRSGPRRAQGQGQGSRLGLPGMSLPFLSPCHLPVCCLRWELELGLFVTTLNMYFKISILYGRLTALRIAFAWATSLETHMYFWRASLSGFRMTVVGVTIPRQSWPHHKIPFTSRKKNGTVRIKLRNKNSLIYPFSQPFSIK